MDTVVLSVILSYSVLFGIIFISLFFENIKISSLLSLALLSYLWCCVFFLMMEGINGVLFLTLAICLDALAKRHSHLDIPKVNPPSS